MAVSEKTPFMHNDENGDRYMCFDNIFAVLGLLYYTTVIDRLSHGMQIGQTHCNQYDLFEVICS